MAPHLLRQKCWWRVRWRLAAGELSSVRLSSRVSYKVGHDTGSTMHTTTRAADRHTASRSHLPGCRVHPPCPACTGGAVLHVYCIT